jgi:hypothetical protein
MLRLSACKQPTPLEIRLRPHHFLPENRLDDLAYPFRACRELGQSLMQLRILEMLRDSAIELVRKSDVSCLGLLRLEGLRVSQRGHVLRTSSLSNYLIAHLFPLSVRHDSGVLCGKEAVRLSRLMQRRRFVRLKG